MSMAMNNWIRAGRWVAAGVGGLAMIVVAGDAAAAAVVETHGAVEVVRRAESSVQIAVGVVGVALGVGLVAAWRRAWTIAGAGGLIGAVAAGLAFLSSASTIELHAEHFVLQDRPGYLWKPLSLRYDAIVFSEKIVYPEDNEYRFKLTDGRDFTIGSNPVLDRAWPLIGDKLEAFPVQPEPIETKD